MSAGARRKLPTWWAPPLYLLLALWAGISVYYWTGASGVDMGGATMSFERQHDFALFRLSDRAALLSNKSGFLAVVKYRKGVFPFCPLCGTYEPAGSIVNLAEYRSGPWVYSGHQGGPFAEIYNVETGEAVDVEEPKEGEPVALESIAAYAERGLKGGEEHRITPAVIAKEWRSLRGINESCVVFNAAFILLFGVWMLLGGVLWLRRR